MHPRQNNLVNPRELDLSKTKNTDKCDEIGKRKANANTGFYARNFDT